MIINYIKNDSKINMDSGYLFSKAVFETIRIEKKAIFLKEHIKRLNKALAKLGINNKVLLEDIEYFIRENNLVNCVLKIVVSEKNIIATTREIMYNSKDYINGFKLSISDVRRNTTSIFPYIKSTAYLENMMEREKSALQGCNDALFLNEKGFVSECSTSNIFFVKNEKIFTPKVSCGLLDGIIRNWIIKKYKVIEDEFELEKLIDAQEVFITNSVVGIMSVYKIGEASYKDDRITRKIRRNYLKVLEDI
ncbi:MAG: aminotransferase class IV [Sarcina sp.]